MHFFHTMHHEIAEFIDKVYRGGQLINTFKRIRKGPSSLPKCKNLNSTSRLGNC